MSKKHDLKQMLAKTADEIEAMAGKSEAEGFKEDIYEALKEKFADIQKQLGRVEEAEKIAANLAVPVPGQDRLTPAAPVSAHKLYGKLKNFHDREIGGRMVRAVDQAYTAGMWFQATIFESQKAKEWCREHGVAITKAQGEGVDSAGGYLVPEELLATIIVLRETFGVFRTLLSVIPMGSDTMNIPRRVGGLTAFFTGENVAVQESQASWDNVNLTAKKLGTLTRMSNELAEDAVISVADWLTGEIAYAFASKEDDCGFNGDGSGAMGGIRGVNTLAVDGTHNAMKVTASNATLVNLTIKDITGTMGVLPEYALRNASWYMSQQMFYSVVATITAGAGGNRLDVLTQGVEKRLLGFPVVIAQKMPIVTPGSGKVMLAFGDLAKAATMGERRGVMIKRSDHRYFEQDQIGLLGTERMDINIHDLGDNNNCGPLAALVSP